MLKPPVWVPSLLLWIWHAACVHAGRQWWLKQLGFHHTSGRPTWNSRLLALVSPTPCSSRHLWSESPARRMISPSFSACFSLGHVAFSKKKFIYIYKQSNNQKNRPFWEFEGDALVQAVIFGKPNAYLSLHFYFLLSPYLVLLLELWWPQRMSLKWFPPFQSFGRILEELALILFKS